MRLPKFADLDEDQRRIFSESPTDASMLIVGPPGAGKTVVAIHRAMRLSMENPSEKVNLLMFNKTLARYSSSGLNLSENIIIKSFYSWFNLWYYNVFGKRPPHRGTKFNYSWDEIDDEIKYAEASEIHFEKFHFGHLLIDEGQDFSNSIYKSLMAIIKRSKENGKNSTLTVFADDNQSITKNNSTLSEIREILNATPSLKTYWRVDKNYRNTREVAKFARYYQVLNSRSVSLPNRTGMNPKVVVFNKDEEDIEQILTYCKNQNDKEVGVFVFGKIESVYQVYKKLVQKFSEYYGGDASSANYQVQAYIGDRRYMLHHAEDLVFDSPPVLTVLNTQSVKGLEFDTVFILNFENIYFPPGNEIPAFKIMYVTFSRPRDHLFICLRGNSEEGLPRTTQLLPSQNNNLSDFMPLSEDLSSDDLDSMLGQVDFLTSATDHKRVECDNLVDELLQKKEIDEIKEILSGASDEVFETQDLLTVIDDRINDIDREKEHISDILVELDDSRIQKIRDSL